jgi:hypothetical protein
VEIALKGMNACHVLFFKGKIKDVEVVLSVMSLGHAGDCDRPC